MSTARQVASSDSWVLHFIQTHPDLRRSWQAGEQPPITPFQATRISLIRISDLDKLACAITQPDRSSLRQRTVNIL